MSYNRGIMGLRSYANGSPDPDDELYRQLMRRLFGGEAPSNIHSYGPDIDDTIRRLITESGATPPPNWVELPDTPEDFFKAEGNRLEYLKRKPDISDPFGGGRTQGLNPWTNPITEGFEPRPKYLPPGNYLPPGHIDLDSDILDQPDIFSPPDRGYGRGRIDDFIREAGGRPPHYLDQQPFRVYPPLPDEHFDNFAEMMGGTMTPEGEVKIPLGQTGDVVGVTTIDPQAAAQRFEAKLAAREAAEKAAKKAAARKAAIRGVAIAGASTLALPAELAAEFALFPEEMGGREASQPRNTYMSQQEMDREDLDPQSYVDIYGTGFPDIWDNPLGRSPSSQADIAEFLRQNRAGTPVNRYRR